MFYLNFYFIENITIWNMGFTAHVFNQLYDVVNLDNNNQYKMCMVVVSKLKDHDNLNIPLRRLTEEQLMQICRYAEFCDFSLIFKEKRVRTNLSILDGR